MLQRQVSIMPHGAAVVSKLAWFFSFMELLVLTQASRLLELLVFCVTNLKPLSRSEGLQRRASYSCFVCALSQKCLSSSVYPLRPTKMSSTKMLPAFTSHRSVLLCVCVHRCKRRQPHKLGGHWSCRLSSSCPQTTFCSSFADVSCCSHLLWFENSTTLPVSLEI